MHKVDKEEKVKAIILDLKRIADELGKTPTIVEYKRGHSKYSYDEILGIFGSWNAAISRAGLTPNPTQHPPTNKVSKEELILEFINISNKLGRIPSRPQFTALSKFSRGPYERVFGAWSRAVKEITKNHKEGFRFPLQAAKNKVGSNDSGSRKPLNFKIPLRHRPQNEMETLILFSLLAEKLGYEIYSAGINFPDWVLIKDGKKILAEVEYFSSSYLEHGHPIDTKYMCICWRKDKDILGLNEVLSLEEVIHSEAFK